MESQKEYRHASYVIGVIAPSDKSCIGDIQVGVVFLQFNSGLPVSKRNFKKPEILLVICFIARSCVFIKSIERIFLRWVPFFWNDTSNP